MKLLDLIEKFSDHSPVLGGQEIRLGGNPRARSSSLDQYEVVSVLRKHGWDYLSSGNHALVFARDDQPQWVLKINTVRDRGFTRFYSMAKRSDNEHFPEVSRMGLLDILGVPVYAVQVERLTDADTTSRRHLRRCLQNSSGDFFAGADKNKKLAQRYPEWYPALAMIRPLFGLTTRDGQQHYQNDVGGSNIMFRGNIPVLIDPLFPGID